MRLQAGRELLRVSSKSARSKLAQCYSELTGPAKANWVTAGRHVMGTGDKLMAHGRQMVRLVPVDSLA